MEFLLPATADDAESTLDSGIASDGLTIPLVSGGGSDFPATVNGSATSAGSATTLNATGIQAALTAVGIGVGAFIENITDSSHAFILSIATNALTTTELQGGSGNDWGNGDNYALNRFIVTLNARNSSGVITSSEKVLIDTRSGDNLTVNARHRGYDGSTPATWSADDYCNLFVVSKLPEEVQKAFGEVGERLDANYTKTEIDTILRARNWKEDVVCATTANGTLSTAFDNGSVIDGITLSTGDRILIKNQTTKKDNGVYTVNSSGAPTRAVDFDATAEITAAAVVCQQGTANADALFICTSDDPVVDTDDIEFAEITSLTKATDADAVAGTDDSKYMTVDKVVHILGNLVNTVLTYFVSTRAAKTTPVLADTFLVGDSAASNADKKTTFNELINAFLTGSITSGTAVGDVHNSASATESTYEDIVLDRRAKFVIVQGQVYGTDANIKTGKGIIISADPGATSGGFYFNEEDNTMSLGGTIVGKGGSGSYFFTGTLSVVFNAGGFRINYVSTNSGGSTLTDYPMTYAAVKYWVFY